MAHVRRTPLARLIVVVFALAAVTAAAPPASPAAEPERYEIKYRPRVGESWAFDGTFTDKGAYELDVDGAVSRGDQLVVRRRAGVATVLEVDAETVTAVRVAFDKACESVLVLNGRDTSRMPEPYAGRTFTLRKRPAVPAAAAAAAAAAAPVVEVTEDGKAVADPALLAELRPHLDGDDMYPPRPVAVGEAWSPGKAGLAKSFDLGPDDRGEMTCVLKSVKTVDGRRIAEVGATLLSVKTVPQGPTKLVHRFVGTTSIDLATGAPVATAYEGDTETSGEVRNVGPDGRPVTTKHASRGKAAFSSTLTRLPDGPGPATRPAPTTRPAAK